MLRGTVSEDGVVTLHFLRILTSFAYCQCKLNTRMTCSMLNALDSPFIISKWLLLLGCILFSMPDNCNLHEDQT